MASFNLIGIGSVLGSNVVDLENEIRDDFPSVFEKTSIHTLYRETEKSLLSMCEEASNKVIAQSRYDKDDIDAVICVTQSAEYHLPSTACLIQHSLSLSTDCMAFDVNQGCSGFVQGLQISTALLQAPSIKSVLLVCADKYSQKLRDDDRSTQTVFSDAATAIILEEGATWEISGYKNFTDGSGAKYLCQRSKQGSSADFDAKHETDLYMAGGAVFMFTQKIVPKIVKSVLEDSGLQVQNIDMFLFHQATALVLDSLNKKMGLDENRVPRNVSYTGNTTSSTIPLLMEEQWNKLIKSKNVVLCGFGVGLSASCIAMSKVAEDG